MSFLFSSIKNLTVGGTAPSGGTTTTTPTASNSSPIVSCYQESEEMRFNVSPPPPPPPPPSASSSDYNISKKMGVPDTQSDFNQWLHAMKMVARLPGGMPAEFRRKLWMALADRYLKTRSLNWDEESTKCLSEQCDEDDEELGIQIVKDLHRTGSSLCSGPSGTINQAKLKRVLLGYSRFNPEVGYCQGFNMLGALILQVMDKSEDESIKVMILLIEGLLPAGYFCGSLGGLQADMAVFRDLLGTRLPKLARHLQKLQGPEGAFEPPLTNVFTMQWFLTLFCTCLPIPLVLRVWDLILIEGSDVLLRTALAIWGILESKILATKTADDFYCKMGALSSELVNGSLVDANALIQRVVDIGPIADLQKLREKHLNSITQLKESSSLKIFYSDDEGESDEDSRLAVTATAWGLRSGRRASLGIPTNLARAEGKEKINLDISLLKKQYDKLRERQRQAHIILTAAVARQPTNPSPNTGTLQVNQLLVGKNALLSAKGKRLGPPPGAVPPVRASKSSKQSKQSAVPKSPKPVETLHWKDMDETKQRRNSLKWRDLPKDAPSKQRGDEARGSSPKLKKSASASSAISNLSETGSSGGGGDGSSGTKAGALKRRSESSSYSEESDAESSTSTSLCDDDNQPLSASSLEASPMKRRLTPESIIREVPEDEKLVVIVPSDGELTDIKEEPSSFGDDDDDAELSRMSEVDVQAATDLLSPVCSENTVSQQKPNTMPVLPELQDKSLSVAITSTSQLSPIPDISKYVSMSTISPLKTPSSVMDYSDYLANIPSDNTVTVEATKSCTPLVEVEETDLFKVSDEGVTNEFFERINAAERPNKLDLNVIKERKVSESLVTTTESVLDRSDNTSKLDNYSFTNISNRSSMSASFVLELPIKTSLQHDSPLLPPSTDLSSVVMADSKQPKYQLADARTPTPQESNQSPEDIERYLTNRVKFLKEKSFSMDDPIKGEELPPEDIAKRSASEGLVSVDANALKSDKMLEIIKENSLILGRIVRKSREHDEQRTDQLIKQDETEMLMKSIEQLPSLHADADSLDLKIRHSVDELLEKSDNRFTDPKQTETEMLMKSIEQLPSLHAEADSLDRKITHSVDEMLEKPDKPISDQKQHETKVLMQSIEQLPSLHAKADTLDLKIMHSVEEMLEKPANRFADPKQNEMAKLIKSAGQLPSLHAEVDALDRKIIHSVDEMLENPNKPISDLKQNETKVLMKSIEQLPSLHAKADSLDPKIIHNIEEMPDKLEKPITDPKQNETKVLIKSTEHLPSLHADADSLDRKIVHSDDEMLAKPGKSIGEKPFKVKPDNSTTNKESLVETEKVKSKTDLVIQRTEEQLARFAPPEPTYYVRKDNFREIITPEEEKTEQRREVPEPTGPNASEPEGGAEPFNMSFNAIDTRAVSSKTEELIKKTEEQLARFRTHEKKRIDKLEKRLSLIDMKLEEKSQPVTSSKTEEILKKSEEQMSRLLARKSPTRFKLDDASDLKPTDLSNLNTDELIKKTDEQLARFKAAAESTAEKRKSRHEIDELLKPEALGEKPLSRSCESIRTTDFSSKDAQDEILRTIQIPDGVKSSKTEEIIKGIEDGKIKLGDDYITTIKTIDYLKRSNANMLATLSSIESSIKAIDGYCDYESDIQSDRISDTIDNLEKSLKQFETQTPHSTTSGTTDSNGCAAEPPLVMVHDYSTTHEARCRPASCNRPSRSRKRKEYSPRRRKDKDRDGDKSGSARSRKDHSSDYSSDNQSLERESPKTYTYASYYSQSPPLSPRLASPTRKLPEPRVRPTTLKSTSHDRYTLHLQRDGGQLIKFDKSPSSPIISKAYLESLKPATPVASGRTTRSAENSPPHHPTQPPSLSPTTSANVGRHTATLRHATYHDTEHSHIKSCENILMRFNYEKISAIAASYPISSALSPSPTKYNSLDFKHDTTLNLTITSSPNKKSLH